MTQTVTLEDGTPHTFPDDATPDEMTQALAGIGSNQPDSMGPLNVPQAEAGYLLNSVNQVPVVNLLKEAGAGIRGLVAAANGGSFTDEYNKSRANQEKLMYNEQQQFPNQNTVGRVGAGLVAAGALPVAGPTGSVIGDTTLGALQGGGYGFLSGLGTGDDSSSRLGNALQSAKSGAEFGGATGAIAGGLNSAIGAYKGLFPSARLNAAQDALDSGIPVYKNNLSDSKALDYLSTASNEIPPWMGGTSGRMPDVKGAVASALNEKIGQTGTELTKESVDQALQDTGKAIGEINKKYSVPLQQMAPDLTQLQQEAKIQLTGDNLKLFNQRVKAITSDANANGGNLPGSLYQSERSALGQEAYATAQGATAKYSQMLGKLQDVIDTHFVNQASPEDAATLGPLRQTYRNAKTLQPLTDSYPLGDFPLTALNRKTVENPDLQPIGNAAQLFKGLTGNSGTAQRELLQKAGAAIGGIGGGIAGLHAIDPNWENNALELGGVAGAVAIPGIANRMFNPRVTPFALNGISALQPYSSQIGNVANLMRRGAAASPLFGSLTGGQ